MVVHYSIQPGHSSAAEELVLGCDAWEVWGLSLGCVDLSKGLFQRMYPPVVHGSVLRRAGVPGTIASGPGFASYRFGARPALEIGWHCDLGRLLGLVQALTYPILSSS